MTKLFHCPGSCSTACLIALEETGAQFETVIIDLKSGKQNEAEYRAINPKGRVPALATDRGVITENPAIMTYIAMAYPKAGLAPLDDLYELARMQSFNAFIASTLQPSLGPLGRPERYANDPAAYPAMATKAKHNAIAHFDLIESELLAGPWVLGNRYSVADGYLFVFSDIISRLSLDAGRYPRVIKHREAMLARPAVQRALGIATKQA